GSDPSGGAGLQADLKTFTCFGVYGMAVPTALTVQNTVGVLEVVAIPPDLVEKQIIPLLEDLQPEAVKTGMLFSADVIERLYRVFLKHKPSNLVLDPVIRSTSGFKLLEDNGIDALIKLLFPLAIMITPNLKEASVLSKLPVENIDQMKGAAKVIHDMGPRYVLVKGGHLRGDAVDLLYDGSAFTTWKSRKIDKKVHGAGCVLSAGITASLALGKNAELAVEEARNFVHKAIENAEPAGKGALPLYLFPG
ncbi:MAG TPA: bifunctional hydroxymethylpyrimidine kinase/phosphomethylpyrimidine kinase, partial [Nitrospiria bacterium]|nr:bifunctional hydroxymethylpyrimidine kinase/phosphomethylpyrimidine kinase [Nitrospiria bacterium]